MSEIGDFYNEVRQQLESQLNFQQVDSDCYLVDININCYQGDKHLWDGSTIIKIPLTVKKQNLFVFLSELLYGASKTLVDRFLSSK